MNILYANDPNAGKQICIYGPGNSRASVWKIDGNGCITLAAFNLVLDACIHHVGNLILYPYRGKANQQWNFTPEGYLTNKANGMALCAPKGIFLKSPISLASLSNSSIPKSNFLRLSFTPEGYLQILDPNSNVNPNPPPSPKMPAIAVENNKEGKAELKLTIEEKDMQCCICLESVSDRIYQCVKGPHYCCEDCTKTINKCPICQNPGTFIRNTFFEEMVKSITKPCPNAGCTRRMYSWDTGHEEHCKFKVPSCKCEICGKNVIMTQWSTHFQNDCKEKFNKIVLESHNNLPAFKLTNQHSFVEVPLEVNKSVGNVIIAFWVNKAIMCWDVIAINVSGKQGIKKSADLMYYKTSVKYKMDVPLVKPEDMLKMQGHIPLALYEAPFLGFYVRLK